MNAHPKLTEKEKAHNEGATMLSASYWPKPAKRDLFCPVCRANLTDSSEHAAGCSRASTPPAEGKIHNTMVKHGVGETAAKIIISNEQLESARDIERNRTREQTEGTKYARLWESRHDLLFAVKDIFKMMDEGILVRDTSRDGDADFYKRNLDFVMRLAKIKQAVDSAGKGA